MTCIRVMAAVIERDGRFLLCQRPVGKRHGGLWEFPGGKVLEGETDLEATRRELDEELGVEVISVGDSFLAVPDEGSVFTVEFVPCAIDGEPQSTEHDRVEWVPRSELLDYDLAPCDKILSEWLLLKEVPNVHTGVGATIAVGNCTRSTAGSGREVSALLRPIR